MTRQSPTTVKPGVPEPSQSAPGPSPILARRLDDLRRALLDPGLLLVLPLAMLSFVSAWRYASRSPGIDFYQQIWVVPPLMESLGIDNIWSDQERRRMGLELLRLAARPDASWATVIRRVLALLAGFVTCNWPVPFLPHAVSQFYPVVMLLTATVILLLLALWELHACARLTQRSS